MRALALAAVAASLVCAACVPVRLGPGEGGAAPAESYVLRPLVPLDERGEATLYGTCDGVGDEKLRDVWHGAIVVLSRPWVDGTMSELHVRAEVDTDTVVFGRTGQAAKDMLLSLSGGEQVRVDVRREAGDILRAVTIAPATELPPAPSVTGMLDVVEGGRGSLRGTVRITGIGASRGTLHLLLERTVRRIPVSLTFAIPWDSSTLLVTSAGRRPLAEALRTTNPRLIIGRDSVVAFRRTPDGLVAEEVRLERP